MLVVEELPKGVVTIAVTVCQPSSPQTIRAESLLLSAHSVLSNCHCVVLEVECISSAVIVSPTEHCSGPRMNAVGSTVLSTTWFSEVMQRMGQVMVLLW